MSIITQEEISSIREDIQKLFKEMNGNYAFLLNKYASLLKKYNSLINTIKPANKMLEGKGDKAEDCIIIAAGFRSLLTDLGEL